MMGFCVNLFTVDASFEMGPRWIFLTDGPFVTISRERVLIFDKNTCAWFAMPERGTEGQREREREREKEREKEEITSSRKNSLGKNFETFLEILSLFPYEMFSWTKFVFPAKKLSLPKRFPKKHIFWRHVKNF